MAIKSGKARVLTSEQKQHLFSEILKHRYPEKNTAIMKVSFLLGLRVQEIALLELEDICVLGPLRKTVSRSFKLREIMKLPARITKGANATKKTKEGNDYERKSITFEVDKFEQMLEQVEALVQAGGAVDPKMFYPPLKKHRGKSRDLPMVDSDLRDALNAYLDIRLEKDIGVKGTARVFLTQQNTPYSPSSLKNHMNLMLKNWAGVEGSSSHSGRRTLLTDVIHTQDLPIPVAQEIAGHINGATTLGYAEPSETQIAEALKNLKK